MNYKMANRTKRLSHPFALVCCLLLYHLVPTKAASTGDDNLQHEEDKVRTELTTLQAHQRSKTSHGPREHQIFTDGLMKSYMTPTMEPSSILSRLRQITSEQDTPHQMGRQFSERSLATAATNYKNVDLNSSRKTLHLVDPPSVPLGTSVIIHLDAADEYIESVKSASTEHYTDATLVLGRNPQLTDTTRPAPSTIRPRLVALNSVSNELSTPGYVENCPSTCLCKRNKKGVAVRCASHLWREVPPLPQDTHRFTMSSPKAPVVILNNSFSGTHLQLEEIKFDYAEIKELGGRAFVNVPNLKMVQFKSNKIKNLHVDLFKMNSVLKSVLVIQNDFELIPHACLCKARGLVSLIIKKNSIKSLNFAPCFMDMLKLSRLDLSYNPISKLATDDFYHLRNSSLRDLRMNGCKIRNLPENLFQHIPELVTIIFNQNKLTHIHPRTFQHLTNLKVVSLSKNRILNFEFVLLAQQLVTINLANTRIKSLDLLQNNSLSNLQQLSLSQNRLRMLKNYTFTLLGLGYLEHIILDKCSLRLVEAHAFYGLPYLRILKLSYNPLTAEMLSTALHGLSSSPLEKLSLQGLKLRHLNNETFAPLGDSNITELRIDACGITTLRAGVFDNLSNLRSLYVSNNRIVEVERNGFLRLPNLEALHFQRNRLTECLNVKTTGMSRSLKYINMQSNNIDQVNFECIRGLDNLIKYDFYGNSLRKIGAKTFIGTNISTLFMRKNKISVLSNDTYTSMKNLKSFDLEGNTIQAVSTGCFEGLDALEYLKLSDNPRLGNQMSQLAIAFENLHSMNILVCDTCGIKELPVHIFTNMANIVRLSLHDNYIVSWDPQVFIHQRKLQTLHLQRNRIVALNRDMFRYLPNLKEIHLHGNPFTCTCDITWFRSWITDGGVFAYIDIAKKNTYHCASPPDVEGTSLLELDLSFDKCGPKDAVIGGTVGGLVFALIVITAGLTYRYRWYIRYGCFLLQKRMRQRRNENGNEVEFAYDAFVSYNHGDQHWVIERLLPALEYRGGIHLCLHDRDWLAGCAIADNIIESIESSRKTVLVLSNNFAKSEWCQLEMSMAQHKLLTTRKDVLVLVMKENIDDVHMSRNLRHLISTQTYLAWDANDGEKQRLFWKALIKAIKNERDL